MNVLETHIELDLRIDDIDSSRYDHILPGYKDMIINDVTMKLIEKAHRAYEVSRDINGLVKVLGNIVEQDVKSPALLESADKHFIDLPSNLLYFLDSRSVLSTPCAKTEEIPSSKYIAVIGFVQQDDYPSYVLKTNGIEVFNTADIKGYATVIGGESFLLRDLVLFNHSNKVDIYWEKYNDLYRKDSFIIVTGEAFQSLTDGKTTVAFTRRDYKKITATDTKEVPNRPHKANEGELYHYLGRPFSEPTRRSPVTSLAKNSLYVFSKKFYIQDVIYSYIRKPRPLNYRINQSSELPEDTQLEIVDMAAQFIKAILADPNYQVIAIENKVLNS